jgi:hypothetical protein
MKKTDFSMIGDAGTAGHSDFRSAEGDVEELAKEAVPDKGPERPMPPADEDER